MCWEFWMTRIITFNKTPGNDSTHSRRALVLSAKPDNQTSKYFCGLQLWFVWRQWQLLSHIHSSVSDTIEILSSAQHDFHFLLPALLLEELLVTFKILSSCPVSLDNSRWSGVELHCHSGSPVEHVSGLLADGVGTGCLHHRHGHCWRGALISYLQLCIFYLSLPGLTFLYVIRSLQESGREKSFRYWPRLGSRHNTVTYGRFKITTRFRTESGCYATTGLKIKHLLTGQERTVWHLQYTDWPDHGCPEDFKGFLSEWDQ